MRDTYNNIFYRFKKEDREHGYVWVDINDPNETLPEIEGAIFAKLLRLDQKSVQKRIVHLKRKPAPSTNINQSVNSVPERKVSTKISSSENLSSANQESTNPLATNINQTASSKLAANTPTHKAAPTLQQPASSANTAPQQPTPTTTRPASTPPPSTNNSKPQVNLLDEDDDFVTSPIKSASGNTNSNNTLNDFAFTAPKTPVNMHDIDDDVSTKQNTNSNGGELNRAELIANKQEIIEDKVKAALSFKKEIDLKQAREQQEYDIAREKFEKMLNVRCISHHKILVH